MPTVIHGFDWPDRVVVGTIGEPGSRTFYLQAREGARMVSVALEKVQSAVLAEKIEQILDGLMAADGNPFSIPAETPMELVDNDPLDQPVDPQFRTGIMSLGWDPSTAQLVIEAFPLVEADPDAADLDRGRSLPRCCGCASRSAPPGPSRSARSRSSEPGDPAARSAALRWMPAGTSAHCPATFPDDGGRPALRRARTHRSDHVGVERDLPGQHRRHRGDLQAGRRRASVVGLPGRRSRTTRGCGVPGLGVVRLERRAPHLAARRPVGPGDGATLAGPRSRTGRRRLVSADAVPDGWRHVFAGTDELGRPVALTHEDSPALRRMAVFDVVVNNADRKGAHILPMAGGHRHGVDHGLTFHLEHKLRTVLWGWLGEALNAEELDGIDRLRADLAGGLGDILSGLIRDTEIDALDARCGQLRSEGRFPAPHGEMPAMPWPLF